MDCGASWSPSTTPVVSNSIETEIVKKKKKNNYEPNSLSESLSTFGGSASCFDDETGSSSSTSILADSELVWLWTLGIWAPNLNEN